MRLSNIASLTLGAAALLAGAALRAEVNFAFEGVKKYSDFSVSGMSEEKTLSLFERSLERDLLDSVDKYVKPEHTLEITVTDIDMAGDIQPWRNRNAQDIRYVEAIYPPRFELSWTLKDAAGEVISSAEKERISDLNFQMTTRPAHTLESFYYELELLKDWLRKDIAPLSAKQSGS